MTPPVATPVTPPVAGMPEALASVDAAPEVAVRRSIAEVDPRDWDSIGDPDDLQSSHRFVLACERSGVEEAAYRHVVIRHGATLDAVATLSRMTVSLELLAGPAVRRLVALPRRLRADFLRVPVVFCGLPVSFGKPCLRIRPGVDRRAILRALDQELTAFAEEEGAPVLCFKEFDDAEAGGLGALEGCGYARARSLPSCGMALAWGDFDAYLASLRAPYRRQILRARALARDRGVRVRVLEDFGAECPRLFALYEQVIDRARYRLERLNLEFFRRLNDDLGPASRAILLEADGRLLACAILLVTPGTATFLLAGIDYARNREHVAYPNLVAAVVEESIRSGARFLEMGQTSYALKTRLGARPEPRWIYLRGRRPLLHRALRSASPVLFPATATASRRVFRFER